ncbi:MAG: hypothetical protein AAGH74_17185, partial [Pseudomonadota bacterium]
MLDTAYKHPDLTALLSNGRMHEVMGAGGRVFAAHLARALHGPVIWMIAQPCAERLCPQGLGMIFEPGRLILITPTDRLALLQAMEEALRSGAAPLVIGEMPRRAPDLTESRRLQLAAGTGGARALCLIGETVTNAAETRWHATPRPGAEAGHVWEL